MRLLKSFLVVAGLIQLVLGVSNLAQAKDKDRDRDRDHVHAFTWKSDDVQESDRAWLGVEVRTLDDQVDDRDQIKADKGVYVQGVSDDSPAEAAGLREGDVITKFNSTELSAADELIDLVSDAKSGDKVTLTLVRDGKTITQDVTLGEWKNDNRFFFRSMGNDDEDNDDDNSFWSSDDSFGYIGAGLNDVEGQLAQYFGLKDREGALVTEVEKDSPAEKAGLKAGDVILAIDGNEVDSRSDVQRVVRRSDEEDTLSFSIMRDKREMKLNVVPMEKEMSFQGMFGNMPMKHRFDTAPMRRMQMMPGMPNGQGMRGLYRGDFDGRFRDLDAGGQAGRIQELQKQMDELRRQMDDLRREVQKP